MPGDAHAGSSESVKILDVLINNHSAHCLRPPKIIIIEKNRLSFESLYYAVYVT